MISTLSTSSWSVVTAASTPGPPSAVAGDRAGLVVVALVVGVVALLAWKLVLRLALAAVVALMVIGLVVVLAPAAGTVTPEAPPTSGPPPYVAPNPPGRH